MAGAATAPSGWNGNDWAAVIAGVVSRESAYGSAPARLGGALKPSMDPGGVGDPTPRWREDPPAWAEPTGVTRVNGDGAVEQQVNAPTVNGYRGWGYGLGQFDRETSGEDDSFFAEGGPYSDPATVFKMIGERLAGQLDDIGDLKGAVAAYNAGTSRVKGAIASGKDPDSVTTGGNYASDALSRASSFGGERVA